MNVISIKLISDIAVISFEQSKIISDSDIEAAGKGLNEVSVDATKIVLNFGKVQFFSSAMIGKIILFRKKVGGNSLKLCCLRDTIRDVFSITRLDQLMKIYNTEEEAVTAFMKENK